MLPTDSMPPAAEGCNGISKLAESKMMVPATPTSVTVCSEAFTQITARPRHTRDTFTSGFDHLVALLNTITTGPHSCNAGGLSRDYTLNFDYPNGSQVTVDINPDCQPGIRNGVVVSNNTEAVVAEIDRLIGLD
jgi:hypothetical protein